MTVLMKSFILQIILLLIQLGSTYVYAHMYFLYLYFVGKKINRFINKTKTFRPQFSDTERAGLCYYLCVFGTDMHMRFAQLLTFSFHTSMMAMFFAGYFCVRPTYTHTHTTQKKDKSLYMQLSVGNPQQVADNKPQDPVY